MYLEKSSAYFIPEVDFSFSEEIGIYYLDPEMVTANFLNNPNLTRNYKFR
jgi:hypothetical protein